MLAAVGFLLRPVRAILAAPLDWLTHTPDELQPGPTVVAPQPQRRALGSRSTPRTIPVPAPPRPIDERARRRQQLQRQRQRKRIVRAGMLVLCVSLAGLAWYSPRLSVFTVRQVAVEGTSSVPDPMVRNRADQHLAGQTIYTADLDAIERDVERLPFVREVTVSRHVPSGISIRVEEYAPLALAVAGADSWLVARDGRVLAPARMRDWQGRIPVVWLSDERVEPGQRVGDEPALQLLRAIPRDFRGDFAAVAMSDQGLRGRLREGTELRLGQARDLSLKLRVTAVLLDRVMRKGSPPLAYIDVSVPARPAICRTGDLCDV